LQIKTPLFLSLSLLCSALSASIKNDGKEWDSTFRQRKRQRSNDQNFLLSMTTSRQKYEKCSPGLNAQTDDERRRAAAFIHPHLFRESEDSGSFL